MNKNNSFFRVKETTQRILLKILSDKMKYWKRRNPVRRKIWIQSRIRQHISIHRPLLHHPISPRILRISLHTLIMLTSHSSIFLSFWCLEPSSVSVFMALNMTRLVYPEARLIDSIVQSSPSHAKVQNPRKMQLPVKDVRPLHWSANISCIHGLSSTFISKSQRW